jgi:hypothetical protein
MNNKNLKHTNFVSWDPVFGVLQLRAKDGRPLGGCVREALDVLDMKDIGASSVWLLYGDYTIKVQEK